MRQCFEVAIRFERDGKGRVMLIFVGNVDASGRAAVHISRGYHTGTAA